MINLMKYEKGFQKMLLCSDHQVLLNSRLFFRVIKPHFIF